jgi:hypothetical protein
VLAIAEYRAFDLGHHIAQERGRCTMIAADNYDDLAAGRLRAERRGLGVIHPRESERRLDNLLNGRAPTPIDLATLASIADQAAEEYRATVRQTVHWPRKPKDHARGEADKRLRRVLVGIDALLSAPTNGSGATCRCLGAIAAHAL